MAWLPSPTETELLQLPDPSSFSSHPSSLLLLPSQNLSTRSSIALAAPQLGCGLLPRVGALFNCIILSDDQTARVGEGTGAFLLTFAVQEL